MIGRNINMFLLDGTSSGVIKASLANWTGVAYKIPRVELDACKDRDHLHQSGVYFLFSKSEKTEEPVVYIGQAGQRKNGEALLYRLNEHITNYNSDDDLNNEKYWIEAIALTTSNNSFGPTEISYLENAFYNIAKESGRYTVRNGNEPNKGHVTEEKESELLEFIENAKIIVGALGHKVFEPYENETKKDKDETSDNRLYYTSSTFKATGNVLSDGFIVYKGSTISDTITKSCPQSAIRDRERHAEKIVNDQLVDDILFNSPSGAASFVAGGSRSGNQEWKNKEGTSLKDIEQKEIE